VAKHFRLEQRVWNACAIDGYERRRSARTTIVNKARDNLFAYATFASDEDFGAGTRRVFNFFFDRTDGCTYAKHGEGCSHNSPKRLPGQKRTQPAQPAEKEQRLF
jgi:hypothetical protein